MGSIMAECNKHIHMGWIYDEHGGKISRGMTAPLSTATPGVAIVWRASRFFIHWMFIICLSHLRNNARGFAYATVSRRGNIA